MTDGPGAVDRLEADLLAWLHGFTVEIAPDDYSAQRVPRSTVRAWFGFSDAELDAVCARLDALGLLTADEVSVCLTPAGVDRMSTPATAAPPRP
ncbi:MAG: hypothetical protein AB7I25_06610 [Vicinamibacterales bacterium]